MARSAFPILALAGLIFLVACASSDKAAEIACQKLIVGASTTVLAKPIYTMSESWPLLATAYQAVPKEGCSARQTATLKRAERLALDLVPLASKFSTLVKSDPGSAEMKIVFSKIQPLVEAHAKWREQETSALSKLQTQ